MSARLLKKICHLALHPSRLQETFEYGVQRRIFPKDEEARRIASWLHGGLDRVPLTEVFPGIEHTSVELLHAYDRTIGTSVDVMEVISVVTIARYIQAKRVLEIGTFDGNTALNLAANTPDDARIVTAVSYTHLTLPTICSV